MVQGELKQEKLDAHIDFAASKIIIPTDALNELGLVWKEFVPMTTGAGIILLPLYAAKGNVFGKKFMRRLRKVYSLAVVKTVEEEVRSLIQEARGYYNEALKQKDPRQMSEKAYLAASLAGDALILACNRPKPQAFGERSRGLRAIRDRLDMEYNAITLQLHVNCFHGGACDREDIAVNVERTKGFINTVISELRQRGFGSQIAK